jgi:hypothetical protein
VHGREQQFEPLFVCGKGAAIILALIRAMPQPRYKYGRVARGINDDFFRFCHDEPSRKDG